MTQQTDRPLLMIDVDGPLNPYAAKPSRRPDGYQTHRMRPSGWTDERRKPLRVWLNPTHGPALLQLPYDLVWCTTWAGEANEWIAPHIGLPKLPFIDWDLDRRPPTDRMPDGTYWKTHQVIEYAAGRPFAWIDDETTDIDRTYIAVHRTGPALLHHVSPRLGLLPTDFDALHAWAESLTDDATACGRCKTPFDPTDTRFDGHARSYLTPYCRRCVDLCHDNEIADHRCVICA